MECRSVVRVMWTKFDPGSDFYYYYYYRYPSYKCVPTADARRTLGGRPKMSNRPTLISYQLYRRRDREYRRRPGGEGYVTHGPSGWYGERFKNYLYKPTVFTVSERVFIRRLPRVMRLQICFFSRHDDSYWPDDFRSVFVLVEFLASGSTPSPPSPTSQIRSIRGDRYLQNARSGCIL